MVYQFDEFELDEAGFRLSCAGEPVSLEPKALHLLLYLLENRNRLVRKQELLDGVWRESNVTENALTRAIGLLRKALNDDSRIPRFIETVPTLGYRFIAAVTVAGEKAEEASSFEELPHPAEPSPPIEAKPQAAAQPARSKPSNKWIVAGVSLLILILGAATFHFITRRPAPLTEKDTIVLADFANTTGDPVFDETLRQGLAVQLEQSPFLSLISEGRTQQVLAMMDKPAGTRLTPEVAREVCERTGSAAVLEGSIASLGSQYVLGLRALECSTQKILAIQQVQAERKEDVLRALTQIAGGLRTHLGESLRTVEAHNMPLADATTPSIEALKAYSTGANLHESAGPDAAIPLLQRAIEIDPGFAMACAWLAQDYGEIGETDLSAQYAGKAYQLRDRANDRERFFIESTYLNRVTGNLDQLQRSSELWAQTYPRDPEPHMALGGVVYPVRGEWEKAAAECQKGLEVNPDFAILYPCLAGAQLALGQIGQSEATLQQQSDRKMQLPDLFITKYDIEFVKGDKAGMERMAALGHASSNSDDWTYLHQAFASAYSGREQNANDMSRRAVDLALQASQRDRAALYQAGAAVWQGLFGDTGAAKQSAGAALGLSKGREVEFGAAFALALARDSSRAQTLANDLESRFPEDTAVRVSYLPSLRALLALDRGDPGKAVDLLQSATPYELGQTRVFFHGSFGPLYCVYVRGEAYLALHQYPQAAAEFQKIVSHPGIVVSDPTGSLAHLQLGRAYAGAGDAAQARMAYRDFFALWKDADPGIPILEQAKAEYAELR